MKPEHLLNFIPLLEGTFTVGHRPKLKTMHELKRQGVTHIVTLLSEKEGALDIKQAAQKAGLHWFWLPLENARPPADTQIDKIKTEFSAWQSALSNRANLYLHCSAGIHRTGR